MHSSQCVMGTQGGLGGRRPPNRAYDNQVSFELGREWVCRGINYSHSTFKSSGLARPLSLGGESVEISPTRQISTDSLVSRMGINRKCIFDPKPLLAPPLERPPREILPSTFERFPTGSRDGCSVQRTSLGRSSHQRLNGSQWVPVRLASLQECPRKVVISAFAWFPVGSRETGKLARMPLEVCHISVTIGTEDCTL